MDSDIIQPQSPQEPTPPPAPKPRRRILVRAGLGLLLIAVIAVGAALVITDQQPHKTTPHTTAPAAATITVTITKDGFSPANVAITKGSTVKWINKDNNPHRIQANPYPNGASLPELDSKQPIGPGATYSYTFTKVGTFGYHDQYHPTTNGTVSVQ